MRNTDIGAEYRCRSISSLPYEHSFPVDGLSCGNDVLCNAAVYHYSLYHIFLFLTIVFCEIIKIVIINKNIESIGWL